MNLGTCRMGAAHQTVYVYTKENFEKMLSSVVTYSLCKLWFSSSATAMV